MTDVTDDHAQEIAHEVLLDAPPEKVWRALTIPAFRERWLPDGELASPDPVSEDPPKRITYRLRMPDPPHAESVVTFRLHPAPGGATRLTIRHAAPSPIPANLPRAPVALAA